MFRPDGRDILRVKRWEDWGDWLVHGFSTRATGDFLEWPSDREVSGVFGAGHCGTAMLRQVHSNRWVRADKAWGTDRPEADAVGTQKTGVLVGVRTADCLPVLLVDPRGRSVAAVHAGWRGTVSGVLPGAVRGLTEAFGTRVSDIDAAVGPGIGVCCFEVGMEVAARFPEGCVQQGEGRPRVDLAVALEAQLASCGVRRCAVARMCTNCGNERFFSHRAESGRAGRMLSVAGLRPRARPAAAAGR